MSHPIKEQDWKVFRELRQVALDRFCENTLDEARREIEREGKTPHERYLALYKRIENRDRDLDRAFDDFRRSTALHQAGIMHSMGLFTGAELRRFSEDALRTIGFFAPIPDA